VQNVISQGLALKCTTTSSHNICDIRAHNVMFASHCPHLKLDPKMEQKFPPYGLCWSSTMFINKHMWIHHKTVFLSLCIMRLKTSGSCLYGAHIYPSSCARFPDQFTLIRLLSFSCYEMIRRSLNYEKDWRFFFSIVAKQREQKMQTMFVSPIHKKPWS